MIRLKIGSDGSQDLKKVCNVCKKTIIQDLQVEDVLVKPTTPPEWTKSGGIPPTPEPGSTSKSGYRKLQKGGKDIIKDLDKLYIYKVLGQNDPKKEGRGGK